MPVDHSLRGLDRSVVVVRGDHPLPPRELLPLKLPKDAAAPAPVAAAPFVGDAQFVDGVATGRRVQTELGDLPLTTRAEGPGIRFALWFQGCPLRCPGCYAYGTEHLGGDITLREVSDYKGDELVSRFFALVDEHHPLHVSIIGGEPLVRFRELNTILPRLADLELDRVGGGSQQGQGESTGGASRIARTAFRGRGVTSSRPVFLVVQPHKLLVRSATRVGDQISQRRSVPAPVYDTRAWVADDRGNPDWRLGAGARCVDLAGGRVLP